VLKCQYQTGQHLNKILSRRIPGTQDVH